MRKMIVALVVLFVSMFSHEMHAAAGANEKATWLWNPWILVNDEANTIDFLYNKQINKVYLQIDRDLPTKVYQSFIEKSSVKGIKVYALDGAPAWVAPKGSTEQNKLFTWLTNYQKRSTSSQKFSGVHLDVEPYLYTSWTTNRATTIKRYQDLLIKAQKSSTQLSLPLEADLPFWFDEITYKNTYGKGTLAEWVISKTSGVTIMAYRDSAKSVIEIVRNEVAFAQKHKKSVVVGVETGFSSEGNYVSFFEEGEAFMNQELLTIKNHYGSSSGFRGIAIHHVGSWMEMKQ
ncbi:amidase [Bacillus pinisoli]|uniref:amidase n=1 Tax=Bacillus pinisoli TaxID=2901866 RepID=UPI001FF318EC|nr:amidase [Bacillus pinisoli]